MDWTELVVVFVSWSLAWIRSESRLHQFCELVASQKRFVCLRMLVFRAAFVSEAWPFVEGGCCWTEVLVGFAAGWSRLVFSCTCFECGSRSLFARFAKYGRGFILRCRKHTGRHTHQHTSCSIGHVCIVLWHYSMFRRMCIWGIFVVVFG